MRAAHAPFEPTHGEPAHVGAAPMTIWPASQTTLAERVEIGLSARRKMLSSSDFYDDRGSRLFQEIMQLPEYYLTRVEHSILREQGCQMARFVGAGADRLSLVELGSGDGSKTLTLCEAIRRQRISCVYHPMDISPLALSELTARFSLELPDFDVQPFTGNYFQEWPAIDPAARQVALLLGSNLGNLTAEESLSLLGRVRRRLRPGDMLLLGLDLKKDPQTILDAYNDGSGVTAAFNLNLLERLNRELEMDFDLAQFYHYATYDPLSGAVRSFLVSRRAQRVSSRVLRRTFLFHHGETIYTEQSQKYDRTMIDRMAETAQFTVERWFDDSREWYTIAACRA